MTSCASRTLPYFCTPTSAAHLASWLFQQSPACRKILFRHADKPRPSERGLFFIRERKCLNLLLSIFFLCEKENARKRKAHSKLRSETFLITAMPQQWIGALAAQGGIATLTEASDATFSVKQFFMITKNEAPQDARRSRQENIEVRYFF